tara:strand:+ start:280 stop:438 length:159 start_codon:yes stop_codon:yes gene_type:complete
MKKFSDPTIETHFDYHERTLGSIGFNEHGMKLIGLLFNTTVPSENDGHCGRD